MARGSDGVQLTIGGSESGVLPFVGADGEMR